MRPWPLALLALVAGCGGDGGPARPVPDIVVIDGERWVGEAPRRPLTPIGPEIKARTAIHFDEFGPEGAEPITLHGARGIPPDDGLVGDNGRLYRPAP